MLGSRLPGTPRPALPHGPYLVVGLARSGLAAARVLAEHGEVIGCDSGHPEAGGGFERHLDSDGVELLDRVHTVVKSPGVPREAPVLAAALDRGMEVMGELELSWRLLGNRFVAVTGTNGKTTTVELLGAIWRAAGMPVAVAGNVGTPLASLVGSVEPGATVICEASSFQLEDATAFAPECAVLLNLEEDHVDRHGHMDAYAAAKSAIFANQEPGMTAVLPIRHAHLHTGHGRVLLYDDEAQLRDGALHWRGERVGEVRLRGAHNFDNAAAAVAAAHAMGVPLQAVARGLAEFAGVPHRLEEVGTAAGVLYVNDSKATNVAAAEHGIRAFDGGVHAILGGSLKGAGFEGLRRAVGERCRACYLIGEAEERLARDLEGTATIVRCGTLDRAMEAASTAARPGEVVLLSPACASFDQFRDYEDRGERFRALVPAGTEA
jgi:UDP-N-acetylmuramoylalanine--D-glutamate ligase